MGAMKTRITGTKMKFALLSLLSLAATQLPARATSVTIDKILADAPLGLNAYIDITAPDSSTLKILVQNTSVSSQIGANAILTGLAFDLPANVTITGGTVSLGAGSKFVNFNPNPAGLTDASGEWGYASGTKNLGHFTGLSVDSLISTMSADTDQPFSKTPLAPPDVLSGPDFGVISAKGDAGGLAAIRDSILITLNLKGNYGVDLVKAIDNGTVAVTLGSPTSVPDGGATLLLLGMAVLGLLGFRGKLK